MTNSEEPLGLRPDPLVSLAATAFDDLPEEMALRAFGVEYRHLLPREGGDLYLTRFGWASLPQLLPSAWYTDRWYSERGRRLPGSTGAVYHVQSRVVAGRSADLVVKFSRMAQEVSVVVATSFPDDVPPETLAAARFNSPFEEFGLVMELRRGAFGQRSLRLRTQRPLAIYAPAEQFDLWRLGRSESSFHGHHALLAQDQEHATKAIELDIGRIYVLVYGWIKGKDAEDSFVDGDISEAELETLTPRVVEELRMKGFRVLDNKPKHFILRRRRGDGPLLRKRDGRLQYGLVDFELLQRTPEHQRAFKTRQRDRYWFLQKHEPAPRPPGLPSHLKVVTIFGVSYLFGATPDGGKVWVTGLNPDLFDYFLPDRWRRTPRLKLSPTNEVYRTRTRDNVHLVYRRSRVGAIPRSDPLEPNGQRIREHGFNSPFEEVAIAARLRQMGIPSVVPRAIYRTAHPSTEIAYLRDDRRFLEHADLLTPERFSEPVLSSDHDYYTLWDRFLGPEPSPESGEPALPLDLESARDESLIGAAEHDEVVARARASLRSIGLAPHHLLGLELACVQSGTGLRRTSDGVVDVRVCLDALAAYELGALSLDDYRHLLARLDARLRAVDCEKLDLVGKHVLLSMDMGGRFDAEENGEIRATLCNFELIRGLYRPIR